MVKRFFELTLDQGMSPEEAGPLVGRTGPGVRIWMEGKWKNLQGSTRRALRDFLDARPRDATRDWDAGYLAAVGRMEDALERIRASVTSPPGSIGEILTDDETLTEKAKAQKKRSTQEG